LSDRRRSRSGAREAVWPRDHVSSANPPLVADLPYRADSADLFESLVQEASWPVFLDSGRPAGEQGRYDILSADPVARLVTRGAQTWIGTARGTRVSLADPLDLLREALGPLRPGVAGLPFAGGAIGYFAYDLARRFAAIPTLGRDAEGLPEMAVGVYDWAVVVDHHRRETRLVARGAASAGGRFQRLLAGLEARGRRRSHPPFRALAPVSANLSRGQYLARIARIKDYLRDGDCYQVNLAQRFAAPVTGDPWLGYRGLRRLAPAPFSAYLSTPEWQILCTSPERFLQVVEGSVETRPIKGTRARGADGATDAALARALADSAKDRAENLMIVDLLRNDLGKVCAIGSVHVPELFKVEHFPQVHHLVSTVRGRLADGRDALDLLRACFPGGSITGAPKRRAMEIIEALEPHRRGVYCGTIGYIGFDGAMDTNIAIRTLVCSRGLARFWVGGGIVADSDPELEYRETYDKGAALLALLERAEGLRGVR